MRRAKTPQEILDDEEIEIINKIADEEHAKREGYAKKVQQAKLEEYIKGEEQAKRNHKNSPLRISKTKVTHQIEQKVEQKEEQGVATKKEKRIAKVLADQERRERLMNILAQKENIGKFFTKKSPELVERQVDRSVVLVDKNNVTSFLEKHLDGLSDSNLPSPGL